MNQHGLLYPGWMRDIFQAPIWHQRPAFRRASVHVPAQPAVASDHDPPRSRHSLPPQWNERQLSSELSWIIPLETVSDVHVLPDPPSLLPVSEGLDDIKYLHWLTFRELLGDPYWTHRGWVCSCALRMSREMLTVVTEGDPPPRTGNSPRRYQPTCAPFERDRAHPTIGKSCRG